MSLILLLISTAMALEPGSCFSYQGKKGDADPPEKFSAVLEVTSTPAQSGGDSTIMILRINSKAQARNQLKNNVGKKSSLQLLCADSRCVVEEGGGSFAFTESPKQVTLGLSGPMTFSKQENRHKFPTSEVSRLLWKFKLVSSKICSELKTQELKEAKARFEKNQPTSKDTRAND